MKQFFLIFSAIAVLFVSFSASAIKLYRWVDQAGHVSYQDSPPSSGNAQEKNIGQDSAPTDSDTAAAAEKFPVVLYAVPKCAACDLARAYLRKRKIPFTEKNVESDIKVQQEMKEKTGGELSVPTLMVGTKVIRGYLESWLESELDSAGYPKLASEQADATPAAVGQ